MPKSSMLIRMPSRLQLREHVTRFFRIAHGYRFYDFELQAAGIDAGLLKGLADFAG